MKPQMTICVSMAMLAAGALGFTSESAPLAERFASPPASARILPIYFGGLAGYSGVPVDELLNNTMRDGFGGMVTTMPFQNYMKSESVWHDFRKGVERAHALGMTLWLYDERGYPSGTAGGETLVGHPEWQARGLLTAFTNISGGATLSLPLPPGQCVAASAYPCADGKLDVACATDLRPNISEGRLVWTAPAGTAWRVFATTDSFLFEHTTSSCGGYPIPYINLLMPEATKRFIELTHDRYAHHFDNQLGRYFVSTFTDEPGLQSLWITTAQWRVLPWSPGLAETFDMRYGRPLLPFLPLLFDETGNPELEAKARVQFWDLIGDLVSKNFFGQIQDWCRAHGIASGGHLLREESIIAHVGFYGDFFRCMRRLDSPGIDCLHSHPLSVPWHIALMTGSIADMGNCELTMCEVSSYVQSRQKKLVTEADIRGTCYNLIWGGINTLTSFYPFDRMKMDTVVRNRLNEQIGRVSTMLKGGVRASDIALYYPIESIWSYYVPSREGWAGTRNPQANQIKKTFDDVSTALFRNDRNFSYVDARGLQESEVQKDELHLKALRWKAVVLPEVETLPIEVCRKLESFWNAGGSVVFIGKRPVNTLTDFPSAEAQGFSARLLGSGTDLCIKESAAGGRAVYLPSDQPLDTAALLDQLPGPILDSGKDSPIRSVCRIIDNRRVYFSFNNSHQPYEGTFRFAEPGVAERWDPVSGKMTTLDNPTEISVLLPSFQGVLFRR